MVMMCFRLLLVALASVLITGKFSLNEYTRRNLMSTPRITNRFVSRPSLPSSDTQNVNHLVLVDLSIRSLDDLELGSIDIPNWTKFTAKMASCKQTIAGEKFLHIHDVGSDCVSKVAISRIPSEAYQRLDLSRRIVESMPSGVLHVVMISLFGEVFLDTSMCDALQAAHQANRFTMPSLKGQGGGGGSDSSDREPSLAALQSQSSTDKDDAGGISASDSTQPDTLIMYHFPMEVAAVSEPSSSSSSVISDISGSSPDSDAEDSVMGADNTENTTGDGSESTTEETAAYDKEARMRAIEAAMNAASNRDTFEVADSSEMSLPDAESAGQDSADGYDPELAKQRLTALFEERDVLTQQRSADSKGTSSGVEGRRGKQGLNALSETLYNTNTNKDELKRELAMLEQSLSMKAMINHGTNVARALASLPPNVLHPGSYVTLLKALAAQHAWEFTEWTPEELRDLGCGAFYAVTQGNGPPNTRRDRLVRLKYTPSQKSASAVQSTGVTLGNVYTANPTIGAGGGSGAAATTGMSGYWDELQVGGGGFSMRPVVLVGKGVCYDTGGVNIKTANSMKTMKHDMGGSSAALGALQALTESNFPYPVECWLALVENNIDPHAYRPDDVVTTVTGDSVEVVHTDAEGRMLLADVLALASRKVSVSAVHNSMGKSALSPKLLIDFATLTGTTISSLSNRYIGVFSNRKQFVDTAIRSGEKSGERSWPFPLDEDYEEDLLSDVADVLQCRQPTEADHIYAASFLKRFVNPTVPWVHLDLGSNHRSGGLGHIPTDYTGSGCRLAMEMIRDICSQSS